MSCQCYDEDASERDECGSGRAEEFSRPAFLDGRLLFESRDGACVIQWKLPPSQRRSKIEEKKRAILCITNSPRYEIKQWGQLGNGSRMES